MNTKNPPTANTPTQTSKPGSPAASRSTGSPAKSGEGSINWALSDRRKHRRFGVQRPGKVFRRQTQQFAPVRSSDLSFSGALLEVESTRPFAVGEIVDIGLAMSREPVVPAECMVQAIVVRSRPLNENRQTVAIRYINSGAAKLVA